MLPTRSRTRFNASVAQADLPIIFLSAPVPERPSGYLTDALPGANTFGLLESASRLPRGALFG